MPSKTGKEMAREFSDWVNGADHDDYKEFAEELVTRTHRTLQQNSMKVFVACIRKWAGLEANWYDLRNEATVKLSKRIVELDNLYLPLI
jgi:hypothetical protein